MSLVQAVDELIAFFPDWENKRQDPIPRLGERWECWDKLDRAVYLEARKARLQNDLPLREGPGDFLGKTNLPGSRFIQSVVAPECCGGFQPIGLYAWIKDLLILRALAVESNEQRDHQLAGSEPKEVNYNDEVGVPAEF